MSLSSLLKFCISRSRNFTPITSAIKMFIEKTKRNLKSDLTSTENTSPLRQELHILRTRSESGSRKATNGRDSDNFAF